MADELERAAQNLEASAKALVSLPDLFRAVTAQQQAQRQVEQLSTLQARQALGLRAELEQQQSLQQLQMQRAQAEAEVRQLRTPQGQAQARATRIEQSRLEEAQRESQRLREGPASTMDTLGAATRGVVTGFNALRQVTGTLVGILMDVGGKASPTHAATLQTSFDLLTAKVGTFLLPVMDELSRTMQAFARIVPVDRLEQAGASYASFLRLPFLTGMGNLSTAARAAETKPEFSLDYLKTLMGFGALGEIKQSYKAFPQAQMGSFEQQYDQMQMAALQFGPLEQDLMQQQITALKENTEVLRGRTGPQADVPVSFR